MKRNQLVALAVVGLVAGLVVYLAVRSRQPPLLPPDADHARFVSSNACMSCHGPDGKSPQSKNHPLGNDCLRCHGRP